MKRVELVFHPAAPSPLKLGRSLGRFRRIAHCPRFATAGLAPEPGRAPATPSPACRPAVIIDQGWIPLIGAYPEGQGITTEPFIGACLNLLERSLMGQTLAAVGGNRPAAAFSQRSRRAEQAIDTAADLQHPKEKVAKGGESKKGD